jgi:hypothetical protein
LRVIPVLVVYFTESTINYNGAIWPDTVKLLLRLFTMLLAVLAKRLAKITIISRVVKRPETSLRHAVCSVKRWF